MNQGEFESMSMKAKLRALEAEADLVEAQAKAAVKRNPWPWIVGALVIGFIAGAVLL